MSQFAGSRCLITGGLGFIGSNLARELVGRGAEVRIVDALITGHGGDHYNLGDCADRVEVHLSDLRDGHVVRHLVRGQDFVFHLAGQVSHGDSMRDPELDLGVNCVSTINLVEACRHECPRAVLVHTSTRQVYGCPRRLPVDESHPTIPVDVNGINKLAAEYYHLLYHRTYDLRSVVLRLTNTYGPRQQIHNQRQGFVGVFLHAAMRGQPIRIFGTGEQRRDFHHVDDVVDALLRAAITDACHGNLYNLGGQQPHSLNELVAMLRQWCTFDCTHVPFPADRKLIDIGDYYGDWSRFHAAAGWQPRISLHDGLRTTIEFFRRHAEHYLR
jgi:nucleoside-diphosphate-sugar epimerase